MADLQEGQEQLKRIDGLEKDLMSTVLSGATRVQNRVWQPQDSWISIVHSSHSSLLEIPLLAYSHL